MTALNQYAALPYVMTNDGILVCLITSRETKRWVIPKGWPKATRTPQDLATSEAWQEAGLRGTISPEPIGTYTYRKKLHLFASVTCRVTVFPMMVETNSVNWREKDQRQLAWMSPKKAAKRVNEKDLSKLILALHDWLDDRRAAASEIAKERSDSS